MYYRKDVNQVSIEEFFTLFGGKLSKSNRWMCLSRIMPWGQIDYIYAKSMSEETERLGITSSWSKPPGAISTRAATWRLPLKTMPDNSAATPARCLPTISIKPGPTS